MPFFSSFLSVDMRKGSFGSSQFGTTPSTIDNSRECSQSICKIFSQVSSAPRCTACFGVRAILRQSATYSLGSVV